MTKGDIVKWGKIFYVISREERFRLDGFDSWEDYVNSPSVRVIGHRAKVTSLKAIYEEFIVNRGFGEKEIDEVGISKLQILLINKDN